MQRKAVALISGGLDSMLAARAVIEQGIHVEGLNFYTGFCVEGHTHAIRKQHREKQKRNNALWVAEQLSIKLHIIDVVEEYKNVVINPRHGYGSNLNPCLDCKIFMVNHAKRWMEENQFDFIITGEVIGQRPKSQLKKYMPIVQSQSGADNRLLRPLCAQFLPITLPEQEGWVNREKLFAFSGRSRKKQFALAEEYGFSDYAQPAGGCCMLTQESYSNKLRDFWQHRGEKIYEIDDIILLKIGRHLRPQPHFKMIIGREEGENNFLAGYRKRFVHLESLSHDGPLALIEGTLRLEDYTFIAEILARYSAGRHEEKVTVQLNHLDGSAHVLNVKPMPAEHVLTKWHI